MEDLAEGLLKGLLRLVGVVVRTLIWLIWELCLEVITWYVGWPVCRALSFNQYPKVSINDHDQASNFTVGVVSIAGLVTLFGTAIVIAKLVGWG
ncbi:hypothetical protein [Hahella ganghwensis]|uniref:hypothetical protein n=1 Tax=Hahella ganghwensis TaxID=286420 RepID=UPI000362F323|nr:hypothetical protein [Hahella ganghwensis]